jgi:hypothetical protein
VGVTSAPQSHEPAFAARRHAVAIAFCIAVDAIKDYICAEATAIAAIYLLSWFHIRCDIVADLLGTRASGMLRARPLFLLLLAAAVQIGSYLAAVGAPQVRACFQASRDAESAVNASRAKLFVSDLVDVRDQPQFVEVATPAPSVSTAFAY